MALNEPAFKKAKTTSVGSENDHNIKELLDKMHVCQLEIEKLNDKASAEILQIEQNYNKIRKPIFQQRNEHFKSLPQFWSIVLSHHPYVSTIIQEEEKDCLNYINNCIAEEFDNIKLGYLISFYFDENPYFENTVITKTMHQASSASARSESTPIKWKEGKDLIKKFTDKISSQGKKGREQLPVTFFTWFLDNSNASDDEIAETIKEDLWPSALQYYMTPLVGSKSGKIEDYKAFYSSSEDEEDIPDELEARDLQEKRKKTGEVDSIAEAELEGYLSAESLGSNEESEGRDDEEI